MLARRKDQIGCRFKFGNRPFGAGFRNHSNQIGDKFGNTVTLAVTRRVFATPRVQRCGGFIYPVLGKHYSQSFP